MPNLSLQQLLTTSGVAQHAMVTTNTDPTDGTGTVDGHEATVPGSAGIFFPSSLSRPGLRSFKIAFNDSDHHVKSIGAGREFEFGNGQWRMVDNRSEAWLTDNSQKRKLTGSITEVMLPSGTFYGELGGAGSDSNHNLNLNRASGTWPAESVRKYYVPVMAGFHLDLDSDHHVSNIFAGLGYHEAIGFYGGLSLGDQSGHYAQSGHVCVAFVPHCRVRGTQTIRGEGRGSSGPIAFLAGDPVLQSFSVGFKNGDHHLKEFAIRMSPNTCEVVFKDDNGDDPFSYTLEIVDLI